MSKDPEKYGGKEAQERFEKALRGGLKTSPKPLKDVPKKREKGNLARRSSVAGGLFWRKGCWPKCGATRVIGPSQMFKSCVGTRV